VLDHAVKARIGGSLAALCQLRWELLCSKLLAGGILPCLDEVLLQ
jgi:hypothetical protein